MSTSFDPYHKWLGIPPDQQPAHHYRLLGIDLFESDADVIEAAANQRTAYLQELAAGEQVELTQKLLNEITQARRCLLNADQKQAYDARLQSQQAVVVVANQHRAETEPEVPTDKTSKTPSLLAGLGIATSVVLIVVLIVMLSRGGSPGGATREAGVLLIRWETSQREGAVLEVDGESVQILAEREFEVALKRQPRFRHRIAMRRTGYKSIERELTVTPDDRMLIRPNWQRERR